MLVRDIKHIRNNCSVGQTIRSQKPGEGMIEAEIIGKYPHFCRVTDNRTAWNINWVDFAKLKI